MFVYLCHICMSEDKLWRSVLSFHYVALVSKPRLDCMSPYPLSLLEPRLDSMCPYSLSPLFGSSFLPFLIHVFTVFA